MSNQCDHIIGLHGGYSGNGIDLGAMGTLVRASKAGRVVSDMRAFHETVAQQDFGLIGYNLRGRQLQEALAGVQAVMAVWDSRPFAEKLKENCGFFNYCPHCGAAIPEMYEHDGNVRVEEPVRVRRFRQKEREDSAEPPLCA